jgi:hypothetical protein
MPGRVHQNDAPALSLASSLAAGATTIPVNQSITGVETPISYTINSGGANQEIVTLVDKNTSTTPSQFENCVRGCDGTADQSHSSGEVLTHEATARDFVDKRAVHSQLRKPSGRLVAFDDFSGPDGQALDGRQAPTGQVWSTKQGAWQIQDNSLQPNSGGTDIAILDPNLTDIRIDVLFGKRNRFATGGIVSYFTDTNNYVYAGHFRGTQSEKIWEVVGGSTSILDGVGNNNWWDHGVGKGSGVISVQVANNQIDLSIPVTNALTTGNTPDSSLQDTYGVGLRAKQDATFEYIAVYQL